MGNLAAIDLGSNSCRLLIADITGKYLFQNNFSVRLGEGLYSTGVISDKSIERATECFTSFRKSMDEYNVTNFRAVTTAACRKASNSREFLEKIKEVSNIDLEIIDGYEEAKLNIIGAQLNADKSKKYIFVFDMGGGSTELTLATNSPNPEIIYSISIPLGARNASEAFEFSKYDEEKANNLHLEIKKYLDEFVIKSDLNNYINDVCFIATSSAPLRIAAIQNGFDKYDRQKADGLVIDMTKIDDILDSCYKMDIEEMAKSPFIGNSRSTIFVPGCIIFATIFKGINAKKIIASLKSAKDAIIMSMANK